MPELSGECLREPDFSLRYTDSSDEDLSVWPWGYILTLSRNSTDPWLDLPDCVEAGFEEEGLRLEQLAANNKKPGSMNCFFIFSVLYIGRSANKYINYS